jgi:putative nucleotidyltransferase with HDIG domain
VLSLTFAFTLMVKHRSRWNRLFFNFSNQLLAALAYTWLIDQTGNIFSKWNLLAQFAICIVAAMIVYALTTFAVALAIRLDRGVEIKQFWLEQYSWLAPMYLGIGVIAFALTLIYQIASLPGLAVILVPMYILRFSQKQYLDHTRESVDKLRENNMRLEFQKKQISRLNDELLQALSYVIDMRDPYVLGHSNHVVDYAVMIARELDLPPEQVELVRKAGLLHDIGKLGISENILHKPGKLTQQEYEIVKQHSVIGANIVGKIEALQDLVPIVRHHHEHYDGNGYPDGLIGNEIPLGARIMALADAVEAMASTRPYKRAYDPDEILSEVQRCSGTQFDPLVVRAFLDVVQHHGRAIIKNSTRERADTIPVRWPLPMVPT